MQTQAYFEEIQQHILHEIEPAKSSIQIAVAWFTDEKLFSALCAKAKSGIAVELMLMNDEINNSSGINYDSLSSAGGKVWKISNTGGHDRLMHNKFCILDNNTVINGSYNWTRKAKQNHESITIISENIELALQFSDEFRAIKENYFGKDAESIVVDFAIICSRLSTVKEAICTGDAEDIEYLIAKFKKHIKLLNFQRKPVKTGELIFWLMGGEKILSAKIVLIIKKSRVFCIG
jgi:phosphatidylserine/phosphatidylglycerophosphate/cardiolipin synthase-like enzyme